MPPELAALADASGGRLVVALVDDLGPATKLAPTLRRERGAGTILLWADDDHLYAPWCGERARDPREYIYTPENDPLEPPPSFLAQVGEGAQPPLPAGRARRARRRGRGLGVRRRAER